MIDGVRARDRQSEQSAIYRAQRYILAAGAIGSPALLLRSGLEGPLVGRYYMRHLCPITIGIFCRRTGADETYVKQIGFADFYFGTKQYRHKPGVIQSLPVPGPLMMAKAGARGLPRPILDRLRKHMLPLTGIVEDLPRPLNRISLNRKREIILQHSFDPYDLERGRKQGRFMARILKNAGAVGSVCRSLALIDHVGHPCGTLRFGNDPGQAVLDRNCRACSDSQTCLWSMAASCPPRSASAQP